MFQIINMALRMLRPASVLSRPRIRSLIPGMLPVNENLVFDILDPAAELSVHPHTAHNNIKKKRKEKRTTT